VRYKINGYLLSENLDSAVKDGQIVDITFQEKTALQLFFAAPDGFVDTYSMESAVWGERVVTQNSLRKLISGLRIKFDDKDAFKNIRGKGYQLLFEQQEAYETSKQPLKHSRKRLTWIASGTVLTLCCLTILLFILNRPGGNSLPKPSVQTVFESKDYILDYALFEDTFFVTTRDKSSSTLYQTKNRQNSILMEADFPGAFRGIEIHSSGKTIMHVIEDAHCIIKIYARPVHQLIDQLACNRQNAFPSFDWIDEHRFYVTFNVEPNAPIEPYIYDLRTQHLEKATAFNVSPANNKKFIDSFIKAHGEGLFSLRINHLDQMVLMYLGREQQHTLYEFRGKPYSVAVSDDNLVFVGNHNELLTVPLNNNDIDSEISPTLLMAPQTNKIDDPLFLQDDLYISVGNTSKRVIYSTSGDFTYSLENSIDDFEYTNNVLTILGTTNTGYVIEQLQENKLFNSVYLPTTLNFRHVAYFNDEIYLAGASGLYRLNKTKPELIDTLKVMELATNGECFLAEADDGVYSFSGDGNSLRKIAAQGERVFSSDQGCMYVDNLSGKIVNEQREVIASPTMNRLLFEHNGQIVHWYSKGDKSYIIDAISQQAIASTRNRVLNKKVGSYGDDILYLGYAEVNTSIVKVTFL